METELKKALGNRLLYENDYFFVIDKDNQTAAHRNSLSHDIKNVVDIIRPYVSFPKNDLRAGIVHRLDRETSGLMLCAKDSESLIALQRLFADRLVRKKYFALVHNRLVEGNGDIKSYLGRDRRWRTKQRVIGPVQSVDFEKDEVDHSDQKKEQEGKMAITHYETVALFRDKSLLDIEIETGRTHQIRVQLADKGYPVVGDQLYSREQNEKALYLYAYHLSFPNPFDDDRLVHFEGTWPDFFQNRLADEKDNFLRGKEAIFP